MSARGAVSLAAAGTPVRGEGACAQEGSTGCEGRLAGGAGGSTAWHPGLSCSQGKARRGCR